MSLWNNVNGTMCFYLYRLQVCINAAEAIQEFPKPVKVTHNATMESQLGNVHISLSKPVKRCNHTQSQTQRRPNIAMQHIFAHEM